jgi:hypothetical protein
MDALVFESLLASPRNEILQSHSSAEKLEQFATDDDAKLVDVRLVAWRTVFGIENTARSARGSPLIDDFDR